MRVLHSKQSSHHLPAPARSSKWGTKFRNNADVLEFLDDGKQSDTAQISPMR